MFSIHDYSYNLITGHPNNPLIIELHLFSFLRRDPKLGGKTYRTFNAILKLSFGAHMLHVRTMGSVKTVSAPFVEMNSP